MLRYQLVALLFVTASSGLCKAEFRQVTLQYGGMQCASCSRSMISAVKRLPGVESVNVNEEASALEVVLQKGNRVAIGELRDAVKRVGFTPGVTRATVLGTVTANGRTRSFRPEGLDVTYEITGGTEVPIGKRVTVGMTIPAPSGTSDRAEITSVVEK